jgi:hypothetical protein
MNRSLWMTTLAATALAALFATACDEMVLEAGVEGGDPRAAGMRAEVALLGDGTPEGDASPDGNRTLGDDASADDDAAQSSSSSQNDTAQEDGPADDAGETATVQATATRRATPTPSPIPPPAETGDQGAAPQLGAADVEGTPTPVPPPTINPTPLPTPTWVPTPTASPAEVVSFTADRVENVAPGETVTLTWEVAGSDFSVAICAYDFNGWQQDCEAGLPLVGSTEVTMPESVFWMEYELYHPGLTTEPPWVRVVATCTHPWFFDNPPEDACPNVPINRVSATSQRFEHGWLIIELQHAFILLDDGRFYRLWDYDPAGGDPSTLTPPEGLTAPAQVFTNIWANDVAHADALAAELGGGTPGEALGWATAPAVSYQAAEQCEFSPAPFSPCYRSGPGGAMTFRYTYALVEGTNNALFRGNWETR